MTKLVIGGAYRHVKRGSTYRVLGRAGMQIGPQSMSYCEDAEAAAVTMEEKSFVVYQSTGEDAELWVRPESEFLDGRFVYLGEM